MATCDPQALLNAANCFDCLTNQQLEQVQVQMLCDIVNGGLAGGPFVRISGDTMTGGLSINAAASPFTVNTNQFSITGAGMVGIGTGAPIFQLHVVANVPNFPAQIVSVVSNANATNGNASSFVSGYSNETFLPFAMNRSGASMVLQNLDPTNGNYTGFFFSNATGFLYGGIEAVAITQGGSGVAEGEFAFFCRSAASGYFETLRLTKLGDLGLGTSVPKSQLDIVGNLTVGATYGGANAAPTSGAIIEGRVGIGTNSPNANALLDLVSTTLGFKLPTMSSAQKGGITNTAGLMVFDTDLGKACVNNGAGWQTITSV